MNHVDPLITVPPSRALANNVPAMIVSFGSNGFPGGTSSVNERENFDDDLIAVSRPMTLEGATVFDDILVWILPSVLMNRMVVSGRLP